MKLLAGRSDDHLDLPGAESIEQFGGCLAIGDHYVDAIEFAERKDGLTAEFAVIDAEDDFLDGVDHRALDIDEQAVGIADSLNADSARAHDGDVGVDFRERFDCKWTNQDAQAGVNHTS